MAITKFVPGQSPIANQRQYLAGEFRRVALTTDSLIAILKALDVPVEIGPADSGGTGYRALRIPN